jgi:N-acetylated-alpha-linked acidic dipeptidase
VYCSWDGEEPGLLGSTEWAETHAEELQQKAVLYLNSDSNGRGFFDAGGSQSLQKFVSQVTQSVRDPETGATVYQRLRAKLMVDEWKSGGNEDAKRAAKRAAKRVAEGGAIPVGALGSGSDYTVFLDHLGIASLNIGFEGESETAGIYHSAYDSFDYYTRFGDPGFVYGIALAQVAGRIVTRAADVDVLPHTTADFADAVAYYADDLHKKTDAMREKTEWQHRVLDEKLFALAADPTKTNRPPESEATVPVLNFAPLDNAVLRLKKSSKAADEAFAGAMKAGLPLNAAQRVQLNALLRSLEQTLLSAEGLPERDWFRHMM